MSDLGWAFAMAGTFGEAGIECPRLFLISWNVAGFRRTHDLIKSHYGSLDAFLARHQADIFCIQETRVSRQMFSSLAESKNLGAITESYESFWAFNELKGTLGGMNGVAVWVKKDLAKGANATQKVLEVDDFDREGRCLMLDLGSLVVFNVYAPHLKKPEENPRKLQFLELLHKRVERVQSEGKLAIVCGDLNLTWRKADVHVNSLHVKVAENCIAGNSDWFVDSKDLATVAHATPKQSTSSSGECEEWIRIGDALKYLQSSLVLPLHEAMEMTKAMPHHRHRGFRLVRLALQGPVRPGGPKAETLRTPVGPVDPVALAPAIQSHQIWSLTSSQTPRQSLEDLEGLVSTKEPTRTQILLQFGVTAEELTPYGHTPHSVNEPLCVEHVLRWLGSDLLDTFAECHQKAEQRFTFWTQLANMRFCNKGSRLDYILCDKKMQPYLVPKTVLAGETEGCDAHTAQAAWNAATQYGRWHGAHQVQKSDGGGLSLQQDDMKLNDTQFCEPHTGILYTPPKYSDHVPVCACFEGLKLQLLQPDAPRWIETRDAQPWTSQATLTALFSSRQKRRKI